MMPGVSRMDSGLVTLSSTRPLSRVIQAVTAIRIAGSDLEIPLLIEHAAVVVLGKAAADDRRDLQNFGEVHRDRRAVDAHDRQVQRDVLAEFAQNTDHRQRFATLCAKYLNAGEVWPATARFYSPQRGVLERIAQHGTDGFYRGPVADAIVNLLTCDEAGNCYNYAGQTRSDATGSFRFETGSYSVYGPLQVGSYRIDAQSQGYEAGVEGPFQLSAGQEMPWSGPSNLQIDLLSFPKGPHRRLLRHLRFVPFTIEKSEVHFVSARPTRVDVRLHRPSGPQLEVVYSQVTDLLDPSRTARRVESQGHLYSLGSPVDHHRGLGAAHQVAAEGVARLGIATGAADHRHAHRVGVAEPARVANLQIEGQHVRSGRSRERRRRQAAGQVDHPRRVSEARGRADGDGNPRALHEVFVQLERDRRLRATARRVGLDLDQDLVDRPVAILRVPAVDLSRFEVDQKILKLIPAEVAKRQIVLPLKREGRTLTVAMANPTDPVLLQELRFITRFDLFPVFAGELTLRNLVDRYYDNSDQQLQAILKDMEGLGDDVEVLAEEEDQAPDLAQIDDVPVVKLINGLLTDAVQRGASDIHIEPFEHEIRVRYRIDGALQEVMKPPMRMRAALISRVKILSSLNIAERRVPQDGRLKLKMGPRVVDFRVSTLPCLFGEKIVLRILDRGNLALDLSTFGIEPQAEDALFKAILNPYGMVLVTGPTGSGKTTTLYSALQRINTITTNIMTVEDPVEYHLPGINQVQVNGDIGLTFATALRAFLRQDPNVIMVGEIRDFETAGIAVKAALTGHLVLSTLHTNDAPGTVTRMLDMGVEAFNVSAAVNLVVAQRLVRRVCRECRAPANHRPEELKALVGPGMSLDEVAAIPFVRGRGCDVCGGTGYKGRAGLFEVMAMSPELRRLVLRQASVDDIREQAITEGMLTLRSHGLLKLRQGVTTLEEVLKETAA